MNKQRMTMARVFLMIMVNPIPRRAYQDDAPGYGLPFIVKAFFRSPAGQLETCARHYEAMSNHINFVRTDEKGLVVGPRIIANLMNYIFYARKFVEEKASVEGYNNLNKILSNLDTNKNLDKCAMYAKAFYDDMMNTGYKTPLKDGPICLIFHDQDRIGPSLHQKLPRKMSCRLSL